MVSSKSLLGEKIGKWLVTDVFQKNNKFYFKAVCDAGHETEARSDVIKKNFDFCFECDRANPLYKTNTYNSWGSMVQRITNPLCDVYKKYGAVGIKCFPDWLEKDGIGWKNFLDYMGECPEGMTLDRWPDKYGDYVPGNVRWATNSEQGYNQKRRNTNKTGRTGVSWSKAKGKWRATITVENKSIHLKYSDSFEEAVRCREEAELKYFGENKE